MKNNYSMIRRLIAILLVAFLCVGCLPEENRVHQITFDGHEDAYEYESDMYKAGEKVVVYFTAIGTDTDYSFYLNGQKTEVEYDEEKGYKIEFEMPANDIDISYRSGNSMVPEAVEDEGMNEQNTENQEMMPEAIVSVKIGGERYNVDKERNAAANSFYKNAGREAVRIKSSDNGGFEKNAALPWELPTDEDAEETAKPGDIVIYNGNTLALIYKETTAKFTRICSVSETLDTKEKLFEELEKGGDVELEFTVDYTE